MNLQNTQKVVMYQILPFRLIILGVAWLTVSALAILEWISGVAAIPYEVRYAVLAIDALLLMLTFKPVWRSLWKWIPGLNRWFPDLNGEYEVELCHNWPIQERLLNAAAGGERFDPRSPDAGLPELGRTKLRASIDLGFYGIRVKMWAEDPNGAGSIIDYSRTLAAALLRPCDGYPARLTYIYQQKNRRDRRVVTDDSTFEGAALLDVQGNSDELVGEYWTNRAWHQGLSTAGIISFRKLPQVE